MTINNRQMAIYLLLLGLVLLIAATQSASEKFVIAQVQYGGGGDWYGDQTTIRNWLKELRKRTDIETAADRVIVKLTDRNLYQYPMLYIVGHGNIRFTEKEVEALRFYLTHGGFLFVNDDYEPEEMVIPPVRDEAGSDRSIVVYGASWCTDTRGTIGFLNRSGIPYRYVDVDRDPEAAAKVKRLNRGYLSTPTLDIEGQIVTEPPDEQLAEVLGLT